MANKRSTHYMRGIGNWMKILGSPVDNFAKDGKEWVMDITPASAADKEVIERAGLADRLKTKGDERGEFITFKQRELRPDGSPNDPISVVDAQNRPWDHTKKIGNGSVVDVKFQVVDYGPGKRSGVYPQAVRVLEHVEYVPQQFAPLAEDDQFFRNGEADDDAEFREDFGIEQNDAEVDDNEVA